MEKSDIIKIELPNNHWLFNNKGDKFKKDFYDLCRFLMEPMGTYRLWMVVETDRFKEMEKIFKDSPGLRYETKEAFRLITILGFVYIEKNTL